MMERGSGTSGSEEHVLLVKLTTKRKKAYNITKRKLNKEVKP